MSADEAPASIQAKARARAQDLLAYSQRQVDRVMSPPTRQRAMDSITDFAARRPILSVLLATQLIFSATPILLFLSFSLATLAFAVLSAAAFSLFWIGIALLFLVPTLAVTGALGLITWVWVVAAYITGRWAYEQLSVIRGDVKPYSVKQEPASSDSSETGDDDDNDARVSEAAKWEGDL